MKIYLPEPPKTPKHQQALTWLHQWGVEPSWGFHKKFNVNYISFQPPKQFPKRQDFLNSLYLRMNPELSVLCYCGNWHKPTINPQAYIFITCPECNSRIKFCADCSERYSNDVMFNCPYCTPIGPY